MKIIFVYSSNSMIKPWMSTNDETLFWKAVLFFSWSLTAFLSFHLILRMELKYDVYAGVYNFLG